ncbi:hypothetical protein COCNU_scaffold004706G000010 [Cocos nucifera]|nr:hypothetical protein [Cocos nucifera]
MSAIPVVLFSPSSSLPLLPPLPLSFFHLPAPLVCLYKPPTVFFSAPKPQLRLLPRRALSGREETAEASASATTVAVDNAESPDATAFVIRARNRIGLLQVITRVFKILGLRIERATVEVEGEFFVKRFLVVDSHGAKIDDPESLDRIERALRDAIDAAADRTPVGPGTARLGSRRLVVRRAGLVPESGEGKAKAERMFSLMDGFLKNDPISLQKDILDHVEYTVARSRFSFDDFEAYQVILNGFQHEQPDYWLNFGNPWEIERIHVSYAVKVEAVAYDNPIPGYGTRNAINLRLWAAKPSDLYDMESYGTGDYVNAVINRQKAETISSVLYPDDRSYQGKELRLKQQYFFVSASVQDIIRRYKDSHNDFNQFPEKVALQLNDTHPSLAIPEVMRVLVDEELLSWKQAWDIVCKIFSCTTHNVVPEGLEKIPVDLLGSVLPRHLQIIFDINFSFVEELKKHFGLDFNRLSQMSIVEEGAVKNIRMANLSIVCCHTVNGVSRVHLDILKTKVFKDFYELWPQKFHYKTNGVTQGTWAFSK